MSNVPEVLKEVLKAAALVLCMHMLKTSIRTVMLLISSTSASAMLAVSDQLISMRNQLWPENYSVKEIGTNIISFELCHFLGLPFYMRKLHSSPLIITGLKTVRFQGSSLCLPISSIDGRGMFGPNMFWLERVETRLPSAATTFDLPRKGLSAFVASLFSTQSVAMFYAIPKGICNTVVGRLNNSSFHPLLITPMTKREHLHSEMLFIILMSASAIALFYCCLQSYAKHATEYVESLTVRRLRPFDDSHHFRLTASSECSICMSDMRQLVFLPCRHMGMCFDCYRSLDRRVCPYCRTAIQDYHLLSYI